MAQVRRVLVLEDPSEVCGPGRAGCLLLAMLPACKTYSSLFAVSPLEVRSGVTAIQCS